MIWYYLKIAFRNLKTHKTFSIINIAGFAFGISICLAIVLFLMKENSYDKHNINASDIVRLVDVKNNSSQIDYRVKDILLENYSEIENGCLVLRVPRKIDVQANNKGFFLDDILSVDNNFFEMFSVEFVSGNSNHPFPEISSAVVTESTAKMLFGTESPIGKEIVVFSDFPVTISGVIKDFPETASISAGLLVNAEKKEFKFSQHIGNSDDLSTYRWPFAIYLKLNNNINRNELLAKVNSNTEILKPYEEELGFLNLTDIYLRDTSVGSNNKKGNLALLKLLSGIATLILLLAIINYVNLTVAQQSKRNKLTGIRKTIGAKREHLLYGFLIESILVSFIALLLAILLILILLPVYSHIFKTTLDLTILFQFPYSIILLASILIIGIVSGIGPALVLSQIRPIQILSGNITSKGRKAYLRNSLTIFQFAISIILIFCVTVINRQVSFVKHKNPGFNEEHLLKVNVPGIKKEDQQKALVLLDELRKSPFVKNLSVSSGVPGQIQMHMGTNVKDSEKNMSVPCLIVDTAFVKTFELEIIKGRDLLPGDFGKVCMVNEAYYNYFELENIENEHFNNFGNPKIIAVVKDFHYSSLHNSIGPACIIFSGSMPSAINVRLADNGIVPGMKYINETWAKILSGYPMEFQFYDTWFDAMYKKEERFAKTIGLFAILAIVISCIGILGLAIFTSERRIKEIGIRKVNGARISEILSMLNRDFVKWVAIAFVIATPISWYVMNKWLENFAYKTNLSWWIFALAGLLALGIALLTVSWQSWKAATKNPVEALRYE